MTISKFQLKYGNPRTFYIRQVLREAAPAIFSAAQVAEACNKLLKIAGDDPLRFTHGNCESALNRMADVSRTTRSTKPNKIAGKHPQGWRLVPPTVSETEKAEIRKLTKQVSLTAHKLPFSQARDWLKQCLAIPTPRS